MISFHDDKFRYNPKPESYLIYEYGNIITSLEQKGVDSEEGKKILLEWLDKKQKEADESESKYSRLKYSIEVAEFYFKIKVFSESAVYVEDAWNIIDYEMRNDDSKELGIMVAYLMYLVEELEKIK